MSRHAESELLWRYLDGTVEPQQREAIEVHLPTCQACQRQMSLLKRSKNFLKSVAEAQESEGCDFEFRRKLYATVARQDKKLSPRGRLQDILKGIPPLVLRPAPVLVRSAALVTIVTVLTVSILFWSQASITPAVASVKGRVDVYSARNKQWQGAYKGMRLNKGDVIKVARASKIAIESETYEMLLKENTQATAVGLEKRFTRVKEVSYDLDKGKMLIATKKEVEELDFKVESPTAEVKVHGTGFLVNVLPAQQGKTWVGVLDGAVEVQSKITIAGLRPKVIVDAGKATEVAAGLAPITPRYLLEDEWSEVQEIYSLGETSQVALLISMTPRRVHELLRPAVLYTADEGSKAMPEALSKIVRQINEALRTDDKEKHLHAIYRLEAFLKEHPDPRHNIQFLFFIVGYYYYLDEYHKAIAVLDRIIKEYPNSRLVSLALCAKGLIFERELNDPANAALAYKAVLTKYPKSLEVPEAVAGLVRLKRN